MVQSHRLDPSVLQPLRRRPGKQIFHLSHVFTRDPNGYFAVNSVFVVCQDELAAALHERLDTTVAEFFREHPYSCLGLIASLITPA